MAGTCPCNDKGSGTHHAGTHMQGVSLHVCTRVAPPGPLTRGSSFRFREGAPVPRTCELTPDLGRGAPVPRTCELTPQFAGAFMPSHMRTHTCTHATGIRADVLAHMPTKTYAGGLESPAHEHRVQHIHVRVCVDMASRILAGVTLHITHEQRAKS